METTPGATLYSDLIKAQFNGFNLAQVDFGPGPDNIFDLHVGNVVLGELVKVNYSFTALKLVAADFIGFTLTRNLGAGDGDFNHVGYSYFNIRSSYCITTASVIFGGTVWLNVTAAGGLYLRVQGQSDANQARCAVGQARLWVDIIRAV